MKKCFQYNFRQLTGFHYDKVEYFIIFNFFGLTSVHLDVEYYSIMDLHLIFKEGEKDTSVSYAKCSLNNTVVNSTEDQEVQVDFICKVEE